MDGRFTQRRGYMSKMPSNLRPVILFVAFFGLFWTLFAGIAAFRNVSFFNSNHESKLGIFYIVMGCIGMVIVAIEAFGIFAVSSRKVPAVRIYAYLSILAALLIATSYILQVAIHFGFKNDIINVCTNANTGDHIFFMGLFGPVDGGLVTPSEAQDWCNQEYSHASISTVVALLFVTAIAAIFALFVFAYLRQLSDSTTSPSNFLLQPVYNQSQPPFNQSQPPFNPSQATFNQSQATLNDFSYDPNGTQKSTYELDPPKYQPRYDEAGNFIGSEFDKKDNS